MNGLINVKSFYSLRESVLSIDDIINQGRNMNADYILLCDDNMFGVKEFYDKCIEAGIKPVVGLETEVSDSMDDSDNIYDVSVIARNTQGYKDIVKLSTDSELGNDIRLNSIINNPNLYVISGKNGIIEELARRHRYPMISQLVSHNVMQGYYEGIEDGVLDTLSSYGVPFIYFNPIRSLNELSLEALDLINGGESATAVISYGGSSEFLSYSSSDERAMLPFIDSTDRMLSGCSFSIEKENGLPHFDGMSRKESFRSLLNSVKEGLNDIFKRDSKARSNRGEYISRANKELETIRDMGYSDYFLIVQDYVNFARDQGIMVGPGRGSAAGSLVAYALHITDVDPITNGLIFERFLNPDRVTMPDIDVDFQSDRRKEVISYIRDKYGSDRVAQIVSFQTYGVKTALRDVMRSFGYSSDAYSEVSGFIADGSSLSVRYSKNFQLRNAIDKYPKIKDKIQLIDIISHMPRQTSTHAAGIVISSNSLSESVPLAKAPNGSVVTQYSKDYIESIGLLKMDILGINDLSIIKDIMDSVNSSNKSSEELHSVCGIPSGDKKTYDLLKEGNTFGVFQLDSFGMRKTLKRIGCNSLDDIVAACSLYRPGPMKYIKTYSDRKKGKAIFSYDPPELEPILKDTYGIFIYQERIMKCATDLAGFTPAEADEMRKAISKKNSDRIGKMKAKFISGCLSNHISRRNATSIFNRISKFANYGFNKAHAVSYAGISYCMAYLKAHYPLEFYTGLLNNGKKPKECMNDFRENGISLLNPSVNYSESKFTVEDGKIRFPLSSISGVNRNVSNDILKERDRKGSYKSVFDFAKRVPVSSGCFEKLAYAGALDDFGYNRTTLVENYPYIKAYSKNSDAFCLDQKDLSLYCFDDDFMKISNLESRYLGINIKKDPSSYCKDAFSKLQPSMSIVDISNLKHPGEVAIIGRITGVKELRTKKNNAKMCRLTVQDETGTIGITVFPGAYKKCMNETVKNDIVYVGGRFEAGKYGRNIVAEDISNLDYLISDDKTIQIDSLSAKGIYGGKETINYD